MVGDRVGLKESEKRLLDREVAGVTRGIDAVVTRDQPCLQVGLDEAALVGWQALVADR